MARAAPLMGESVRRESGDAPHQLAPPPPKESSAPGRPSSIGAACGGVSPTRYLCGSALYLLGSVFFFVAGLGGQRAAGLVVWTHLIDAGNFAFVLGSILFVHDWYVAAARA